MTSKGRKILAVLAAAQFLMVLDKAVMNVSISQLVEGLRHRRHDDPGRHHALLAGDGGVHGHRAASSATSSAAGARSPIGHAIYGTGSLLTALSWSVPVADAGLVGAGGDRRRAGAARAGRPDGAQLRGKGARARLRGPRRRVGRGDRGRADPGRLGDDVPDLAAGLRGRGRGRDRDPALRAPAARRAASGRAPSSTGRRGAVRGRSGAGGARRPRGQHLGLAAAAQLADHPVRLLADPVRGGGGARRPCRSSGCGSDAGSGNGASR